MTAKTATKTAINQALVEILKEALAESILHNSLEFVTVPRDLIPEALEYLRGLPEYEKDGVSHRDGTEEIWGWTPGSPDGVMAWRLQLDPLDIEE